MARQPARQRSADQLAPGPLRPGLRFGVEREGKHSGEPTLVVLGLVQWHRIAASLAARRPSHVYWEVGHGETPWTHVRRLLRRPDGLTVTVEVDDPGAIPPDILASVEVVARVPAAWRCVDTVKINHGWFTVSWTTLQEPWRVQRARDYEEDVQLWP